jgi:cobalt ECF transporter T component CbiQ
VRNSDSIGPNGGESAFALSPVGAPGRRARRGWFEKTVEDITGAIQSTVFAEEMANLPGIWQRVDPRSKLVAAIALILAASLAHNIVTLLILYALALLIAVAGRIPLPFFVRRVWLFLPFFTAIIAVPAIFSFVTPGRALLVISEQPAIAITEQGVRTAAFLLLRVACSVSFAVILILTTHWGVLLTSLRALHVPQVFVLILGMTYRYIFVLLRSTNDMFLARKSRLVGRVAGQGDRVWIANSMGALLGKSYHLSDEVYLAMVSRGFRGDARTLQPLKMRPLDVMWMFAGLLAPAAVIVLGG